MQGAYRLSRQGKGNEIWKAVLKEQKLKWGRQFSSCQKDTLTNFTLNMWSRAWKIRVGGAPAALPKHFVKIWRKEAATWVRSPAGRVPCPRLPKPSASSWGPGAQGGSLGSLQRPHGSSASWEPLSQWDAGWTRPSPPGSTFSVAKKSIHGWFFNHVLFAEMGFSCLFCSLPFNEYTEILRG